MLKLFGFEFMSNILTFFVSEILYLIKNPLEMICETINQGYGVLLKLSTVRVTK